MQHQERHAASDARTGQAARAQAATMPARWLTTVHLDNLPRRTQRKDDRMARHQEADTLAYMQAFKHLGPSAEVD